MPSYFSFHSPLSFIFSNFLFYPSSFHFFILFNLYFILSFIFFTFHSLSFIFLYFLFNHSLIYSRFFLPSFPSNSLFCPISFTFTCLWNDWKLSPQIYGYRHSCSRFQHCNNFDASRIFCPYWLGPKEVGPGVNQSSERWGQCWGERNSKRNCEREMGLLDLEQFNIVLSDIYSVS